ncbi:energy transducer TonB [Thiorhodococcus fuscus]|uniref:Energy transducer TonB n=1 Tax=Thiorhodococcus fuscus TaxID=527200 RepID=A0ABW4Y370_9GAMM
MSRIQRCRRCIWAGIACSAVLHAAGAAALLRLGTPADPPHQGETTVPIELGMFGNPEPAAADAPATTETPGTQPSPATARDETPPSKTEPEPETETEPTDSSADHPEPPPPPIPVAPTVAPKLQPKPTPTPRPLEPNTERRSTKPHHDKAPEAKTANKTTKRPPKPTPKPKVRKAASPTNNPAPAKTKRTPDHGDTRGSGSRAQGSADGNGKGSGTSPGVSKARQQASERTYLSALQRAISRQQRYPASARRRQQTGTTTLAFVIQANGHIGQIRIVKSSGHPSIDRAALDAMRRLGRFKPIPTELNRRTWALQVPIRFDLQ